MSVNAKSFCDRPRIYAVFCKETMHICKQEIDPHGKAFDSYNEARDWAESRAAKNPGKTYVILNVWAEVTAVKVEPAIETTIYK